MLGKLFEIPILPLPDCWLEAGMYPDGPETCHLDIGILGFPPS
jgi:hypothetical protein